MVSSQFMTNALEPRKGRIENSPAIYRWGHAKVKQEVPSGTKELIKHPKERTILIFVVSNRSRKLHDLSPG
jgi:hypothetical protein